MTATTQSGKKSSQYNLKLLNLEINSSIGKLNTRSSSFAPDWAKCRTARHHVPICGCRS